MEGTDSATMGIVTERHEADRHADAGELKRQRARRDAARGADPAYEGVAFAAGRRWVSR